MDKNQEIQMLRDKLSSIADLGSCARARTPAYKLFQEAIDIAMSVPSSDATRTSIPKSYRAEGNNFID